VVIQHHIFDFGSVEEEVILVDLFKGGNQKQDFWVHQSEFEGDVEGNGN
jgi:hypothetical protein